MSDKKAAVIFGTLCVIAFFTFLFVYQHLKKQRDDYRSAVACLIIREEKQLTYSSQRDQCLVPYGITFDFDGRSGKIEHD